MARKASANYDADDIIRMVTAKQTSAPYQNLYTQMEGDFDLFALLPFKAEEGHQAYTSPAAKNDCKKVFHNVNKSHLTYQVKVPPDAPADLRKASNKGEYLLAGVYDRVDRQLSDTGEPTLREGLTWFMALRGMGALKCLIYKNERREQVLDIRYLDPLHVVFEKGVDGLLWAAYTYTISAGEAEDRGFPLEKDDATATVIDFFDRRINATVLYSGLATDHEVKEFVKKPTRHGLKYVPVWVGFTAQMPTVYRRDGEETLCHRAASVYDSSRNIYEVQNKQISFIMDTAEKSVSGTLVHKTPEGRKFQEGDPFASWKVVNLRTTDTLEPLAPPPVPKETAMLMGVLDRDRQESGIPYPVGFGVDPQAHSGAALSTLTDNMRSIYGPYTGLLEDAYRWLCGQIFAQFKLKGEKMKLRGFDPRGDFFEMDIAPDDVRDDWYIDVRCEPKLPRDEAAELQMAQLARQPGPGGTPLLSDITIREKILQLQNPDAEQVRVEDQRINDMITQHPSYVLRAQARALLAKGDRAGAEEMVASLDMLKQGGPPGNAGGAPQGGPPPSNGAPPPEIMTQAVVMSLMQALPPEMQQRVMAGAQQMIQGMMGAAPPPQTGAPVA